MWGIVGYIGHLDAYPIIIEGLRRLEYRGYDSAGIALYDGTNLNVSKTKGKVTDLECRIKKEITTNGTVGIGHTRWATHGIPNDVNAHPHYSNSGNLVIIHNGIIENYESLKKELIKKYPELKNESIEIKNDHLRDVGSQSIGIDLGAGIEGKIEILIQPQ